MMISVNQLSLYGAATDMIAELSVVQKSWEKIRSSELPHVHLNK